MIDQVLFGTYLFGLGAIGRNISLNKKQDEEHEYIKGLREYDLSTDKLRPEHIDDKDVLVLLKLN